jgi:hypothetical protein
MYSEAEPHNFWAVSEDYSLRYDNWPITKEYLKMKT